MPVHAFHWLVTKSKLVESVHGVAVARVNCKTMAHNNSSAVILMHLLLPAAVGGKLRSKKCVISSISLADLLTFVSVVCGKNPGTSSDSRLATAVLRVFKRCLICHSQNSGAGGQSRMAQPTL